MEVDLVHNTLGYLWAVIITKNERTDTIVFAIPLMLGGFLLTF